MAATVDALPETRSRHVRWWIIAIPAAVGLTLSLLLGSPLGARLPGARTRIYLTADAAGLAWVMGLLASAGWGAARMLSARARRRCEARVSQARSAAAEERRRFLRRLDHELKNPLTAVQVELANLEAMACLGGRETSLMPDAAIEGGASGDLAPASKALASVKAQTARMGGLVADLRKLAELETQELVFDVVDIGEVLNEVVTAALDQATEPPGADPRSVTLTLPQAPWPLPSVDGDWDLLFLAVYNLVSNALKFTAPNDTIELRAFEEGHDVVIEVADTGSGIPEDEQPLVWEELYRAEAARGIPGSGLGLALVRVIVARHGGNATLRSREGQGTVVTVRLPAREG